MRSLLAAALGAIVALTTACYDLPAVDHGVCGNHVLEPGEDCDGDSTLAGAGTCGEPPAVNACAFVCVDATECPTGWGCGLDGRCRRASGTFVAGPDSPLAFPVDSFAVGDVDGDHHADLVGNDQAKIAVRFGTDSGSFPTEVDVNTRAPQGDVTFGDFDKDARLDAVIPVEDGLSVMLGSSARTLEPVAYASFNLGPARALFAVADDTDTTAADMIAVDTTQGRISFVGSTTADLALPVEVDPAAIIAPIQVSELDVNPANPASHRQDFALAFAGSDTIYLYTSTGLVADDGSSTLAASLRATVVFPGPVTGGDRFADVDGDGRPDLLALVFDPDTGIDRVAVAYNLGAGVLGAAAFEPLFDRPTGIALPLATGDLNGDGWSDYVLPDAIVLADVPPGSAPGTHPSGLLSVAFPVQLLWSQAAIGDFNGDRRPDVVTSTEARRGLEIFLGTGLLFNKFRIDTERPPRAIPPTVTVGDFDGDLVDDVAFAEVGEQLEADDVSVVFGSKSGGFGAPVGMGELGQLFQLIAADVVTGTESLDHITDLFAVAVQTGTDGQTQSESVAIMFGDSSRRLMAPYRLEDGGVEQVPHRTVVGDFDHDGINDLLALAQPPGTFDPTGKFVPPPSFVWFLPGQGGAGALDTARVVHSKLADYADFDMNCTAWAVGDLHGTSSGGVSPQTDLVGLDSSAACRGLDQTAGVTPHLMIVHIDPSLPGIFTAKEFMIAGDLTAPQTVELSDLDGDGDLDLVVMFRGDFFAEPPPGMGGMGPNSIGGAGVGVVWNQAGDLDYAHPSVLTADGYQNYIAAQPIDLDGDGFKDLVVVTDAAIYQSTYDPVAKRFGALTYLMDSVGARLFGVGDLNGDGLDDLAYAAGSDVIVELALPADPLGGAIATVGKPQMGGLP